jgi:tetratricopeptide (TPR) repeat protein
MIVCRTQPLLLRLAYAVIALFLFAAGVTAQAAMESVEGLGALDFPTSTKSAAAQTAFVRGMLLLHVYEYPRAEKAFQQAEKLDPDFVMAYWGEAMTATHPIWNQDNPAAGRAALAKLGATPEARAAKATTPREKAWLGAVEALFGPGTVAERDRAFLAAMEAIAKASPQDDEAQLFLAQALLGVTRGDRNTANYLRAAEICKAVLARNPQHPGAAHYWIHGMDDPAHAAGALPAARVLAKIAPDAGHAQHMVSHIFVALGMWDDVVAANEHSVALTDAQARAENKPPLGCGHYSEWLQYAYYQQGRLHDAGKRLDDCMHNAPVVLAWLQAHPGEQINMQKTPDGLKRYLDISRVSMRGTMLVETAKVRAANRNIANAQAMNAKAAITLPLEDADGAGRAQGLDAFAVGYVVATAGDLTVARAQLQRVRQFASQPAPSTEIIRHLTEYLGIAGDLLEAMIEHHAGKQESAHTLAARAASNSDALPVEFGPPAIFKPPHELAGELLLADKQPQAALAQFDLSLKTAPMRADSLLGRARALKASGNIAEAARAYGELAAVWKNADGDLPALAEVRRESKPAVVAESKP